jgi:SAM-dependent methyltransferase
VARRARELAEPSLVRRGLRGRVPPRRLRARTGAPGIRQFLAGGQAAARELEAVLEEPFSAYPDILDFGCGSARVLPHVAAMSAGARCVGCDVDAGAITWARSHHPGLSFAVSGHEPPLPFSAASFDLVYSISVLSHLDELGQDRWLGELRRVLRPGGRALLSVHGCSAFEQFRRGQVRTAWCAPEAFVRGPLREDELLFVAYQRSVWNQADLPGVARSYGLAFHGERYVRERWQRWFEVERIVPRALTGWQDAVLLRRAAAGA